MVEPVLTPITQALADGVLTRAELRALMQRSNAVTAWRLAAWVALVAATGSLVWLALGTWWLVAAMLVHGIVLVHHFSLQHECTHFTAFRTRWLNDLVGAVCGFIIGLAPRFFRYEHCDHHTHTQIVGRDPELIELPRSIWGYLGYVSSWPYWRSKAAELTRHALGRMSPGDERFVPEVERAAVILEARLMLLGYLAVVVAMVSFDWWAPLWFWIVPVLLGEPVMRAIRMTEHVGRPTVADMTRNTRTNLVSAPSRFLCWNMNYHAEHHYAASVPYHALPALHAKLRGRLPVERGGYPGAHREILARILERSRGMEAPGV